MNTRRQKGVSYELKGGQFLIERGSANAPPFILSRNQNERCRAGRAALGALMAMRRQIGPGAGGGLGLP